MEFRTSRRPRSGPRLALLALTLLVLPAAAWSQGVTVAIVPAEQSVAPGAELDVEIQVTQAGAPFNGFDAVVSYDPAALEFMPASPTTNQQGCLMTGACSAACGSTFHRFTASSTTLSSTDILLCDAMAITGPGQIYKLHFRASNTPQVTWLRFSSCTFYNAGFYVTPVTSSDGAIGIGVTLAVGDPRTTASGLGLDAQPNPAWREVTLGVRSGSAGFQALTVFDVAGRAVRRLASGWFEPGERRVRWDGRNDAGRRLSGGMYFVRFHTRETSGTHKVVLAP